MSEDILSAYEKVRNIKVKKSNLNALAKELCPYDSVDILGRIGALALLPENGSHLTRLEALAASALTNVYDLKKPKIARPQFQRIIDRHLGLDSSVTSLEDSCPNLFTESMTFFDGSYMIFPGLQESSSFILRNICRALFLNGKPIKHKEFKKRTSLEIMALLLISDAVAKKANLNRGISPGTTTWDENIRFPDSKLFKILQASVTFSENELEGILASKGIPVSCIEPYLCVAGTEKILDDDFDGSCIYTKPIVKLGNKYVVLVPGRLITANIHRILSLAVDHGARSELVEGYRAATWDNVQSSLKLLYTHPISEPVLLETKQHFKWLERCYRIDTDKFMYAQYFTDDLKDYDVDKPFSDWVNKKLPKLIIDRQEQTLKHISQELPHINNVVWLVIIQGYGRPFQFTIDASKLKCPTIELSVAELEVLGYSEHGDQLAIWKYLKRKLQVREKYSVQTTSEIDEFEFYRSFKHSYPVPYEEPGIVLIKPGTGGDLIRKTYSELDLHGVVGWDSGTTVEVISSNKSDVRVSIVSSFSHSIDRSATVVEHFSIPVWVVGQEYANPSDTNLHPLYNLLGDSIAYWLCKCKEFVAILVNPLSGVTDRMVIELSLQRSETWQEVPTDFKEPDRSENIQEHISVKTDKDAAHIKIDIRESLKTWFLTPDNRIERELINLVLRAIRDLTIQLAGARRLFPTEEDISKAIDFYIPKGIRKTIVILPVLDPRFDAKPLPEIRLIQEADEVDVSQDIRRHLKTKLFPDGALNTRELKTNLLNDVTDFLYKDLAATISGLNPSGLLEFLLSQYEAIVHKYNEDRVTIPIRLGTSYGSQELIRELGEETPRITLSSMAVRFIIEFVSACTPNGSTPISVDVFDRLMALSAEIIELGSISDRIYYELDNTSIEIRSGVLLIGTQEPFRTAFNTYMPNYFGELIARSIKHFDETWQIPNSFESREGQSRSENRFDKAFLAEFGLSFEDYQRICGYLLAIGYEQPQPTKYMPLELLISEVSKETSIPPGTVSHLLDLITLKQRDDFLKPPYGYEKWEVMPWKYNRSLSLVRKPLILVQREAERGILWGNRYLFDSARFLQAICYNGRLKASSKMMKVFVSDIRNEDGTAFNDEVYNIFIKHSELKVRKRIEKFCGIEMYDVKGKLGDVDVLVIYEQRGIILVVECKNLNAAISPSEYSSELKGLFIDGDKDSEATKLLRRTKWIKEHIELVLKELNVSSNTEWEYRPFIVTSDELFTPYLRQTPVTTISLRRLLEEFMPSWI